MDVAEFLVWAEQFKNWGRWGPDDEIGTLNHVTPEHIVEASRLVRKGRVISLAIPFNMDGPQRRTPTNKRFNAIHAMLKTGIDDPALFSDNPPILHVTDDMATLALQGQTQWDSLAHVIFKGRLYNDRPHYLVTGNGAERNSMDKTSNKIVGRGVLLDFPRYKGVDWLTPGTAITIDDLEGCAAAQGVEVRQGDFLMIRTGHVALCKAKRSWDGFVFSDCAGLSVHTVPWLFEKKVASVAADNFAVEVHPTEVEGQRIPFHLVAIAYVGLLLGEILDLDELAEDCAEDGVYEFFFVAPPLPITGSVGSPMNPQAIK